MNNQYKYLLTGGAVALTILILLKAITAIDNNTTFWFLVLGTVAATMISLVVNIFINTKTIAQRVPAQQQHTNRKN